MPVADEGRLSALSGRLAKRGSGKLVDEFVAATDEDGAHMWQKRSANGEAGAHAIDMPLKPPEKPVAKYPTALRAKLHESYVSSYLTDKVGVHATAANTRLAKGAWPIRLQDTEVTATFKARGNQGDKLFMTPSEAATTLPQKQLIKGDHILGVNLVSKPRLAARAQPARRERGGPATIKEGRKLTFDEFKQKFVFPFSLRVVPHSAANDRMNALHEKYNADRETNRQIHGTLPKEMRAVLAMHEAQQRRRGGPSAAAAAAATAEGERITPGGGAVGALGSLNSAAAGSAVHGRRGAAAVADSQVDPTSLSRGGIPWNPFIDEDLEVIAEGRRPIQVTLKQMKHLQEMLVGVLPIDDLRDRCGVFHPAHRWISQTRGGERCPATLAG
jgi:hypothetical protein